MRSHFAALLKPVNVCLFVATILGVYYFQFPAFRAVVDGVIGVVASPVVQTQPDPFQDLAKSAAALNAEAPVRVDEITEMVRVDALRPLTIRFVYRTGFELSGSAAVQHIETDLRPMVTAHNCTDATVREVLDAGAVVRHDYHDLDMEFIGTVRVDRWDCRQGESADR